MREAVQELACMRSVMRDAKLRQGLLTADRPERAHTLIKDAEAKLYS